jgi:hypothetical protein
MPDSTMIPEVLNRALDLGEAGIQELVKIIENVAPKTWEIVIRQIYVNAIGDCLYAIIPLIIFSFIIILSMKYWGVQDKWQKQTKITFGYIVPIVGATISFIVFCCNLTCLIQVSINPEYYAIQLILSWV